MLVGVDAWEVRGGVMFWGLGCLEGWTMMMYLRGIFSYREAWMLASVLASTLAFRGRNRQKHLRSS